MTFTKREPIDDTLAKLMDTKTLKEMIQTPDILPSGALTAIIDEYVKRAKNQ